MNIHPRMYIEELSTISPFGFHDVVADRPKVFVFTSVFCCCLAIIDRYFQLYSHCQANRLVLSPANLSTVSATEVTLPPLPLLPLLTLQRGLNKYWQRSGNAQKFKKGRPSRNSELKCDNIRVVLAIFIRCCCSCLRTKNVIFWATQKNYVHIQTGMEWDRSRKHIKATQVKCECEIKRERQSDPK